MSGPSTHAFLKHIPLFSVCHEDELARLAERAIEQRYEKGQMLFQRGDPCQGMYVLVYGRIKIAIVARQGTEKVIEIIHPSQSFGEAVMFLEQPYPVMAQAVEDSLVLFIPAETLFTALDDDSRLARRMLAGLSMRLRTLLKDVETYTLESAVERVVGYLLNSLEGSDGNVVSLPVNKQTLASRLNLTPETFSRVLQKLSEQAGIEVEGREIRVPDRNKLSEMRNLA